MSRLLVLIAVVTGSISAAHAGPPVTRQLAQMRRHIRALRAVVGQAEHNRDWAPARHARAQIAAVLSGYEPYARRTKRGLAQLAGARKLSRGQKAEMRAMQVEANQLGQRAAVLKRMADGLTPVVRAKRPAKSPLAQR